VVKRVVAYWRRPAIRLDELALEELVRLDSHFDAGAFKSDVYRSMVHVKNSYGGTSPRACAKNSSLAKETHSVKMHYAKSVLLFGRHDRSGPPKLILKATVLPRPTGPFLSTTAFVWRLNNSQQLLNAHEDVNIAFSGCASRIAFFPSLDLNAN